MGLLHATRPCRVRAATVRATGASQLALEAAGKFAEFCPRRVVLTRCGIDMVWLDAAVAGCVSTWLSSGGSPDAGSMQILREGVADLDHVVRVITRAEELRYTRRLRELAVLIVGDEAPPAG